MKLLKKLFKEYKTLNTVRVHKEALLNNLSLYHEMCPNLSIAPVLKSNAYGHGLVPTAALMESQDCPFLIVDSLYEAYSLTPTRTPVLILGSTPAENFEGLWGPRKLPFTFTVFDFEGIETYSRLKVPVHIEVDTGMHRMGFDLEALPKALKEMKKKKLNVNGLFTHLADADNPEDLSYNSMQLDAFRQAIEMVYEAGFSPQWIHAGNSAGGPAVDIPEVNMMRLGIGLYGYPQTKDPRLKNLRPALEFESSIIALRKLKKGDKLSYNCTFEAPKDMEIAVLSAGYYEGIPRILSNQKPFLGRICMNHSFVEAEASMKKGDPFLIYALEGKNSIENMAKKANTISYELLTGINESVRRYFV